MSAFKVGERVGIRRNNSGYKISGSHGEMQFKRTTSLNEMPKPWLGRWAANEAALVAIAQSEEIAHLLSVSTPEQIAAGVKAIRDKDYRKIPPNIKAVYDLVKEAPWHKRDDAGDFGTVVHNTLEALVKGEPLPEDLQHESELSAAASVEELYKDLAEGGEILSSETSVINPDAVVPYAGTYDLTVRTRVGDVWLLDFKTSAGVYTDYVTQLVAYRYAPYALINPTAREQVSKQVETWTAEVATWGPGHVDRLGIVHVGSEGAKLYEIMPDVQERAWKVFQAASTVKEWSGDVDDYRGDPKLKCFSAPILEATA